MNCNKKLIICHLLFINWCYNNKTQDNLWNKYGRYLCVLLEVLENYNKTKLGLGKLKDTNSELARTNFFCVPISPYFLIR